MKTKLELDDINRAIASAQYHQFPGTTMTVCCLTLVDGFNVIGQSACIDPSMFDEAMGRSIAHEDAVNKVWQLEGYLLNYKLRRGIIQAEQESATAAAAAPEPAESVIAEPPAPPVPDAVAVGTTGVFYGSDGSQENAEVIHVWSESCVNLLTASGQSPTSVLVFRDPTAPGAPTSYFFVPGAQAVVAPAPVETAPAPAPAEAAPAPAPEVPPAPEAPATSVAAAPAPEVTADPTSAQ